MESGLFYLIVEILAFLIGLMLLEFFSTKFLGNPPLSEMIRQKTGGTVREPKIEESNPNGQRVKMTFEDGSSPIRFDPIGAILQRIEPTRFKFRNAGEDFEELNMDKCTAILRPEQFYNFLTGNEEIEVLISKGHPINFYEKKLRLKGLHNAKLQAEIDKHEVSKEAFLTDEVEKSKKLKDISTTNYGNGFNPMFSKYGRSGIGSRMTGMGGDDNE